MKQIRLLTLLVLLMTAATGAWAQSEATTYKVTIKNGVKDATNWTITPAEATTTGVTEGTEVTLKYNGRLKVKNVTATSDAVTAPETIPLTLEALTNGTIVVSTPQDGMQYAKNGGAKTAVTADAISVVKGDKIAFYGKGTDITTYYTAGNSSPTYTSIAGGTAEVKAYGNIMSLVDETGFATNTKLTADYAFTCLFFGNTKLTDASELQLPATTLTEGCYAMMFYNCSSLTKAPELPATTLTTQCYVNMFNGCTSLTTAPELPATTLAQYCYSEMFNGCTSLTTAPELPATTLAKYCYGRMFEGCTSLTTAPELKATTLATECYQQMFNGCISLTSAYVKAAYTYNYDECISMFEDCTATGAVLHTTPANKASWEAVMGSGKTWSNWTVADDWEE